MGGGFGSSVCRLKVCREISGRARFVTIGGRHDERRSDHRCECFADFPVIVSRVLVNASYAQ
ncbi:MAG: hypothetical protein CMJ75_00585 [Planctomycetaceae bacterium]|nr:hypothetical protein [Planctomycetaceae bacterium]